MNGGLESAIEYCSPAEITGAVEGFAYFGRHDIATVLQRAIGVAFPEGAVEDQEEREQRLADASEEAVAEHEALDDHYHARISSDQVLVEMFEARLQSGSGTPPPSRRYAASCG